MNPRSLLNLALALALLLLGALVWHAQRPAPPVEMPRLTTLREADITRIAVRPRDAEATQLERRDGEWRLATLFDLPADDEHVRSLLALARTRSLARYPADAIDPGEAGLATPALTVRLNDTSLQFGGTEPLHGWRYVRNGDTVHLILDRYSHSLRGGPTSLASPTLLPPGSRLHAIVLPDLQLREEHGQWRAEGRDIDPERLRALAEAWETARALRLERVAGKHHGKSPRTTITLQPVGTAPPVHLTLQREADAVWLVRPDLGLRYRFTRETARHLLQPPAATPTTSDPAPTAPDA